MTTVSNASPLIGLSAIGLLDLLPALYGDIHIPEAVYEEVVLKGKGRAGARRVAKLPGSPATPLPTRGQSRNSARKPNFSKVKAKPFF